MRSLGPLALLAGLISALPGCGATGTRPVRGSGTIELDEIDVASLVGGRVAELRVEEGDTVRAGDTLAVLERGELGAALEAQVAEASRARALLADQQAGSRTAERRVARAELDAAKSALTLAEAEFERVQMLVADHIAAAAELDRAREARDSARARRDAAQQKLALLEAGARTGQVAAARAAARAADAQTEAARTRARELVLTAPARAVVLLKDAVRGDVVGPGVPVLTLGDPDRLWIRVFVPAPDLPRVTLGAPATIRVRGAGPGFTGRVREIATRAEFTPRAALTEEERSNLVFGVKIVIDASGGRLKPGLPADVTIETTPARSHPPRP